MTRVKRGVITRKRHKKILKRAKGFLGRRSTTFRAANEALLKAGKYAWIHRRLKKRDFRALWNIRISAALMPYDLSYSKFMGGLKKATIKLNRKVLSELAVKNPEVFKTIVETVKK
ncbi:50S ribosomal protein L20 [Patescibacteria group bacterium]|nr:50S ribosomal protein L20 [Patescibacteria group bacterium]MBU4142343.1 50S ribosomal protein L20 [Patescibacteria group bacterium]MBU4338560.1 50S ribosomal protein L20 [Patescibacteria group bacterium]MBU4579813.1 50S ribosomal protein L20 [Patescibacteria group bacterium]